METAVTFLLMLLLLGVKGFFSGSEIALVSVDRVRLRLKAASGSGGAKLARRLLEDPTRLLTTTLLGGNISSIALTTVGTMTMVGLFGGAGELIALILFTPLFLILGEIVPKSVYQQKAGTIVPVVAWPLSWVQLLLAPLVWLFSQVARLAAALMGGGSKSETARDQFLATVQMAEKTGAAAAFQRGQVRRVLRFAQMSAAEAMWPLAQVRALPNDAGMAEIIALRRDSGQRLIPLHGDSPADIRAIIRLESWDLLDPAIAGRDPDALRARMIFAPAVQRVSALIEDLQADPDAVAVIVDEQGAACGFVTMNLLMRETLGAQTSPLTDRRSQDENRPDLVATEVGWEIDATCPVARVNDELDTDFPTDGHHTIGGVALAAFGRLPETGDATEREGWRIEVLAAHERAVTKLRLTRAQS